jgi:3-oxoacyl-[acyl-carrier-protein] synthase-3
VLSNVDLERFVDTNDEWITSRTGIKRRHVLAEGETMVDHAAAACNRALEMAGVAAGDIDLILLATSTPDDAFGSACQVGAGWGHGPRHLRLGGLTSSAAIQQPAVSSSQLSAATRRQL